MDFEIKKNNLGKIYSAYDFQGVLQMN